MLKPYRHDPFKAKARNMVTTAIRRGELVRPTICGRCGEAHNRIHAHHADYNRPLEVLWYCPTCHKAVHPGVKGSAPLRTPLRNRPSKLAPGTGSSYVFGHMKEFLDKAETEGRTTFIARGKTYEITLKWS